MNSIVIVDEEQPLSAVFDAKDWTTPRRGTHKYWSHRIFLVRKDTRRLGSTLNDKAWCTIHQEEICFNGSVTNLEKHMQVPLGPLFAVTALFFPFCCN